MKKGISLIVLVITIIVLAILAGAIIISLSSTNIMTEAGEAVTKADKANAKAALTLIYAEAVSFGDTGYAYTDANATTIMTLADYKTALLNQGFDSDIVDAIILSVDSTTGCPTVATN